jgi:hypothetical protein
VLCVAARQSLKVMMCGCHSQASCRVFKSTGTAASEGCVGGLEEVLRWRRQACLQLIFLGFRSLHTCELGQQGKQATGHRASSAHEASCQNHTGPASSTSWSFVRYSFLRAPPMRPVLYAHPAPTAAAATTTPNYDQTDRSADPELGIAGVSFFSVICLHKHEICRSACFANARVHIMHDHASLASGMRLRAVCGAVTEHARKVFS